MDGIQYESFYQIKVKDGDWWVGVNDHWLGYYPAKLFAAAPSPNKHALMSTPGSSSP